MRFLVGTVFLSVLTCTFCALAFAATDQTPPTYKLLLTSQRLHRLQRDRDRQTIRWANFDARVQSSVDSPERGFELALYYAVAHDESRGREAVEWALAHPCEKRQLALILDWCAPLITAAQRERLANATCNAAKVPGNSEWHALRDRAFISIVNGQSDAAVPVPGLDAALNKFAQSGFRDPETVYALCELVDALRINHQGDIRRKLPEFFERLPAEYLLAMQPATLDQPGWQAAIAALALVSIDPNLQDSQFLQGWAIEDRQLVQDGPGVAYEFLWGDPYLPGVSFQNLDPWYYNGHDGRFIARTDWQPNSCWIDIEPGGKLNRSQCPTDLLDTTATFGRVQLIPLLGPCAELPAVPNGNSVLLWTHKPGQKISARIGEKPAIRQADASGLLLVPSEISGKVCAVNR